VTAAIYGYLKNSLIDSSFIDKVLFNTMTSLRNSFKDERAMASRL
jgi:hypothetical protein